MNLQNLKYFLDIADTGSISAAARKNVVAQQSMSAHLKKLEAHYGVALFFRTSPLRLTVEGERLYAAAKKAISLLEDFETSLRPVENRLVVGLAFNGTPPFLSEILGIASTKERPLDIHIRQNCSRDGTVPEDVDVFIGMESPGKEFRSIPLIYDTMVVAMTKSLAESVWREKTDERFREIAETHDLELLRPFPFAATVKHPPDLLPHGFHIALSSDSSELMNDMCRQGRCAILVMEDYARRAFRADKDILLLPIHAETQPIVSLYYRPKTPLPPALKAFLRAAREYFRR